MKSSPAAPYDKIILICVNDRPPGEEPSCAPRGSVAIANAFKEAVKAGRWKAKVRVSRTLCLGQCAFGPNIAILPDNVWYRGVRLEDVDEIVRRHLDSA